VFFTEVPEIVDIVAYQHTHDAEVTTE